MDTYMAEKSTSSTTIKFLCSYGGKILPRYPDGKLRYHSGETRVLAVDRFISFAELLMKLRDLCGASVNLRCQLPTEDLDALVSITSDEDLINLMEEYDGDASLKIRAFLSLPKKLSPSSPTSTGSSSSDFLRCPINSCDQCSCQMTKSARYPRYYQKCTEKLHYYYAHGKHSRVYLVYNDNH